MASKEFKTKELTIYITDGHVDYRGSFIFHCYALGIACKKLEATDLRAAANEALAYVTNLLEVYSHSCRGLSMLISEDNY